jgi:hypothetical protein
MEVDIIENLTTHSTDENHLKLIGFISEEELKNILEEKADPNFLKTQIY